MSWVFLFIAGFFEIVGVAIMKQFALTGKKLFILILFFSVCFKFCLFKPCYARHFYVCCLCDLDGYRRGWWSFDRHFFYKESKNFAKIFFLTLIIVSSVGLKFLV